jgi:uncharacterized damage-inducible protein DinB
VKAHLHCQARNTSYTGWLSDGTKFDSSVDRKEPLTFVQGRRQVIVGWDLGFEGMKAGGKRRLFIPHQLAYGEKGIGPIPGKAELIFDVELLDVKDVPELAAAVDVLMPLKDLEMKVLGLAKAMPEEKYSWRPAPGVRSFGEVMRHVAVGNNLMLKMAMIAPSREALTRQIEEQQQTEKQPLTKEQTIATLTESFTGLRRAMESMRPGALAREADFWGTPTTRRGILVFLDTHIAEHVGQAIAYARMNGVVPPWSEARRQ